MTRYVVHAYENTYGGLHGMEDWFYLDTDSMKEVDEAATQASYEIMESYSCIMESLEENARNACDDPDDEEEYEQMLEEECEYNVAYDVYILNDEGAALELGVINAMIAYDPEELVRNYTFN